LVGDRCRSVEREKEGKHEGEVTTSKTKAKTKVTRNTKLKESSSPPPKPAELPQQIENLPELQPVVSMANSKRVSWTVDNSNGRSSLQILLDWLTTEGNYDKYRGGASAGGKTKDSLCGEIVAIMKTEGIRHRNNGDIRTKINELERKFKEASEWRLQTGQGILESSAPNSEKQVGQYMAKICKYYDQLHPIMSNRPSTRPLVSSETTLADVTSKEPTSNKAMKSLDEWAKTSGEFAAHRQKHDEERLQIEKTRLNMELMRQESDKAKENVLLEKLRAETQAAKAAAILVKYQTRQKLLDLGMSSQEVEDAMKKMDF
jgi:hypothetical protein